MMSLPGSYIHSKVGYTLKVEPGNIQRSVLSSSLYIPHIVRFGLRSSGKHGIYEKDVNCVMVSLTKNVL